MNIKVIKIFKDYLMNYVITDSARTIILVKYVVEIH